MRFESDGSPVSHSPRTVHCLGTGGYFPNATRHTSCYWLPDAAIVLDAGTGLFRLYGYPVSGYPVSGYPASGDPPNGYSSNGDPSNGQSLPPRIDIVLSHGHLDHIFGLTTLLVTADANRQTEFHLWAQPAVREAIEEHLFAPVVFPASVPWTMHTIDDADATLDLPLAAVSFRRQTHPGGSLAMRIEHTDPSGESGESGESAEFGESVVYATDTVGSTRDDFADGAAGCDLLIHECYFGRDHAELAERTGHTHAGRLVEIIRRVRPDHVLVTHVNPLATGDDPIGLDWVRCQVDVPVELASDEMVVPVVRTRR